MGFLEVFTADFMAGDLSREREDGHAAAMTIVQAVDEVQVARAAASGADGQTPGEVRFRARGERRRFLMPHVYPLELVLSADGVRDAVEGIAGDSVHPRDPACGQGLNEHVSNRFLAHGVLSFVSLRAPSREVRGDRTSPRCRR